MRKCGTCGTEFEPTRDWQKFCKKRCRRNDPKKRETTKQWRKKRRDKIDAIKLAKGCTICGYSDHPAALDFNHRDQTTKKFNVSQDPKKAWDKILLEIEKCDILCANCHRIHTHKENHYVKTGLRSGD